MALNSKKQVLVWGKRMGFYATFDMEFNQIARSSSSQIEEINMHWPRLLRDNLIHYKFNKLIAGQSNHALITEENQIFIQGLNCKGQLGLREELSKKLVFFPNFMKADFFVNRKLEAIQASFGIDHTVVLAYDREYGVNKVFGCGSSRHCELGRIQKESIYEFQEIKLPNDEEVTYLACGSLHTLFITKSNKLYGCGLNSHYQVGQVAESQLSKKDTITKSIVEIPIDG